MVNSVIFIAIFGLAVETCYGQGAGAFDLGDHREGQLSGQISPLNIFAIVLGCIAALCAVSVTFACACFTWKRYVDEQESNPRRQYNKAPYAFA